MSGVGSRVARLGLVTVALALVLALAFHRAYPEVGITAGLELVFALAGLIVALAAQAAWDAVARVRRHPDAKPTPTAPPPGAGA